MVLSAKSKKGLAATIKGCHATVAAMTGVPILDITEDEAERLASAVGDIVAHYGVGPTGPALLWCNLLAAVGIVYVPRYLMMRALMQEAKRQQSTVAGDLRAANQNLNGDGTPYVQPPAAEAGLEIPDGLTRG